MNVFETLVGLREFTPDMLLNAVSIRQTAAAFDACKPYLPDHCVLVDVTSVKGTYRNITARKVPLCIYASNVGPTFANVNDLREENVILISDRTRISKNCSAHFSAAAASIFSNSP